MSQQNNGFIYIGSLTKPYYDAAVMSAESVKDYWPEAKITLFTHEPWVNEKRDSKFFDNIVTSSFIIYYFKLLIYLGLTYPHSFASSSCPPTICRRAKIPNLIFILFYN